MTVVQADFAKLKSLYHSVFVCQTLGNTFVVHLQVDGTAIQHDGAEGKDTLVADKLKSPDRSESSRAKSSRHHSSLSPERSPRHKHSKRHKKEHSHKKSKRNRHEDDASVGAPSAAVVDGEAPNEDPVESFEERKEAAAADNDLNALRQAALQTTKAAVSLNDTANGADANVEMAGIDSPGALE